jgi:hypothetical protein
MAKTAHGIEYGTANPGKAQRQSAKGRSCEHPGCATVLSVYNESPTCWVHSAPSIRRTAPRL